MEYGPFIQNTHCAACQGISTQIPRGCAGGVDARSVGIPSEGGGSWQTDEYDVWDYEVVENALTLLLP